MIVVTIDLAARPPATAIDNPPTYLFDHVSWAGCYGIGGLCRPKLTEEIEFAQDVRRIEAILRVRSLRQWLRGKFLLSCHPSTTASLVASSATKQTLSYQRKAFR